MGLEANDCSSEETLKIAPAPLINKIANMIA